MGWKGPFLTVGYRRGLGSKRQDETTSPSKSLDERSVSRNPATGPYQILRPVLYPLSNGGRMGRQVENIGPGQCQIGSRWAPRGGELGQWEARSGICQTVILRRRGKARRDVARSGKKALVPL